MAANTRYNYKNLVGAADTVVSKRGGTLHTIVINTTASSAISIYDGFNSSGTKIANIAASPVIGSTLTYDIEFGTGLFVSVGGASDITLSIG